MLGFMGLCFLIMLFAGMPIGFALGATALFIFLKMDMPILLNMGIKLILLEGGGTLNWSFIELDLIDEMRLTIAPWIIGGKEAISLVEGEGFEKMTQGRKFKLVKVNNRDNYVILKYMRRTE